MEICSFCGKSKLQVKKMVVNGDYSAAICNECVEVIVEMIEDQKQEPESGRGPE